MPASIGRARPAHRLAAADHKNRDSKQLRPLLDEVLDDCEALRPFPAPDRVATLAVQMKARALRRCVLVCGSADAVSAGSMPGSGPLVQR
ncbi:hypothetical protein ULF88_20700 [Halopseudomonas pachastrellae]|nr:hypothetical protein [Halopseudomonas pachastrellae]